jgi:thioredoxin 1
MKLRIVSLLLVSVAVVLEAYTRASLSWSTALLRRPTTTTTTTTTTTPAAPDLGRVGVPRRARRRTVPLLRAIESLTSQEDFDRVTTQSTSPVPVVIDFVKSGCKPCMQAAPLYEALSKAYDGKALFYKIDADASKEALMLMKAVGIRSVPTFHVWRGGTRIDSIQGAHVNEVEDVLKRELEKSQA